MLSETLGFIGGGNMARSLIGGLLARGLPARQIVVADPLPAMRERCAALGVRVSEDNVAVARSAQAVVLAVKPQQLRIVAQELAPHIAHRPIIISVAAGMRASDIRGWIGLPVIRAMPNTPALHGCGVSGLFAPPEVSEHGRAVAESILGAVGPALWVQEEQQMDIVTAVSGSGPAYFFLLIEMLEAAGTRLGLAPEVSRRFAIETAYGSGQMARATTTPPSTLREQVTSKGGTTEAALKHLEAANVRAIFADAIAAAARRSAEMAEQFGKDGAASD